MTAQENQLTELVCKTHWRRSAILPVLLMVLLILSLVGCKPKFDGGTEYPSTLQYEWTTSKLTGQTTTFYFASYTASDFKLTLYDVYIWDGMSYFRFYKQIVEIDYTPNIKEIDRGDINDSTGK